MTFLALSQKGFGTVSYLETLDTDYILDMIEYINIQNDIETVQYEDAKSKNS